MSASANEPGRGVRPARNDMRPTMSSTEIKPSPLTSPKRSEGGDGGGDGGDSGTSSHCSFAPLSHSHAFASLPARAGAAATYQLGGVWAAIVERGAGIVAVTGAGGGSSTKAKASLAAKALFSHAALRCRMYICIHFNPHANHSRQGGGQKKKKGKATPLPLRRSHRSSRPTERTCLPQLADHRSITFYTCLSLAIQ